ncbi:hypothetical protein KIN20_022327 [Parelaphostrongylus tenuis]|uniref:Lipoprotein n=1 Tax=Parelaphostrongylus tenuis TaxID=148309 RepID=A0AAD5MTW4_PARTN|nr:hypothetical protein KIN20_022327 [Parelaphostrongylus tenuis]
MNVFTNMARPPTAPFAILLLPTISAVFGCGVMPAGQEPDVANNNDHYCIVASNTVTGICTVKMKGKDKKCSMMNDETIASVPDNHTSISGTLSTTNIVMANWSRMMWQSVLDRALRLLASRPFGSHFLSATGTVGGN